MYGNDIECCCRSGKSTAKLLPVRQRSAAVQYVRCFRQKEIVQCLLKIEGHSRRKRKTSDPVIL